MVDPKIEAGFSCKAALAWVMSSTAWRRGSEPSGDGPVGKVGPFAGLLSMSWATSSGSDALDLAVAHEPSLRRRICQAQDHRQDVDTQRSEFGPQRLGEQHVEDLGRAVGGDT